MNSEISVIIPAHNRAHLIGETLRSLLNQTLAADEIIVVDDGSTDDTANSAQAAFTEWSGMKDKGQKSPEFKVIRQENKGPAAARNAGFRVSKGEFIHFFDSDDLAASNKHALQLAALKSSGADIAYGPWLKGNFQDGRFHSSNLVLQQKGLPRGKNEKLIQALLTDWSVVPHACLFRRGIVEKAKLFPEDLMVGEDQFMFLSCLLAGGKIIHSPGTIEYYRLGDAGKVTESPDWAARRLLEWARFLLRAREICVLQGIEPRHWMGYRRRLWEALEDLRKSGITDEVLMTALSKIVPNGIDARICSWHRKIDLWSGGVQQRLSGGRATRSFCLAPITREQINLLQELGYHYQPPKRLPWF
jgi:glycosyltransferase involved in cell wall biosynthesis